MLNLNGITVRHGGRTILDRATAALPPYSRIGLIGRNGAGKSTLMKVMIGSLEADDGSLEMPKGTRIGYIAQEAPAGDSTPFDTVLAADTERAALMIESEQEGLDHDRMAEVHERLIAIDAYTAPARASRILVGLGFDEDMQGRPLDSFSGGWKMRVALASLLFSQPDLLLLDEPSNHLDLEATLWLENFLKGYPAMMVVISHERDLLNNVVDHILHLEGGQACVQLFFIRANQSWGNRDFYPRTGAGAEEAEILEAFLAQFYDDKEPPKLILLSHAIENEDLIVDLLSERAGRRVEVAVPQRGEKAELVENARRNARESLARKMAEGATQNKLLAGLAEAFDLDAPPTRIEVYDNAHIQGSDAVGGMIVAGAEGFLKSQYRKFNIKSAAGANSDDFGMMREVMTRRFERLLKEDPDRSSGAWPDLLLIDGGAGQVSAVAGILAELGVDDIAMVGVAKGLDRDAGKEEFYRTGLPVMALQRNDPVLYFIQRLRDEAHRWANGAHRAKRAKAVSVTPLDDVPGVGAVRKRALLAHFGSAKAVSRAGVSDLMAVPGVSATMAQAIADFFSTKS